MLGWQAKGANEICIAANQCAVWSEEKESAKTKIKEEVFQMVLLDKVAEQRKN